MDRWTCPACKRQFGKQRQSHMCNPGLTVEEYFEGAPEWERPIFDVVTNHVCGLGDVIIDPLEIGVLLKHGPMFCEMRRMKKWVALGFVLRRKLTSDRLSRKVVGDQRKFFHVVNVSTADEIDGEVLDWLSEAYYSAAGTARPGPGADPMVPDDIDDPFAIE